MRSDRVVLSNVFADGLTELPRGAVFVDIDLFLLQASEPALHHDVVSPALPPVHALRDVVFFQKVSVFLAGELTALVTVENCRSTVPINCIADSLQHVISFKRIRQPPADNLSAVSVDDCSQVHVVAVHFDIGDVDRPILIGE